MQYVLLCYSAARLTQREGVLHLQLLRSRVLALEFVSDSSFEEKKKKRRPR